MLLVLCFQFFAHCSYFQSYGSRGATIHALCVLTVRNCAQYTRIILQGFASSEHCCTRTSTNTKYESTEPFLHIKILLTCEITILIYGWRRDHYSNPNGQPTHGNQYENMERYLPENTTKNSCLLHIALSFHLQHVLHWR